MMPEIFNNCFQAHRERFRPKQTIYTSLIVAIYKYYRWWGDFPLPVEKHTLTHIFFCIVSRTNLLVGRNIQENGPWGAILFYLRARTDNERFFSVPISKSQYTKGVIKVAF